MSPSLSLFLDPPTKFPFQKCGKEAKLPVTTIYQKKKYSRVSYNHHGYARIPCKLVLQATREVELAAQEESSCGGIGIIEFFRGKNILVTGGTGLVGKVLAEKLLRSTSVGMIYMLIKAKDEEAALARLTKEVMDSELFNCLKEKYGKSYKAFVSERLIPIAGDICEPNLGMDSDSAYAIKKDVDVIIQSAACTTLNERYDLLLDANVNAPQRLMRFAKTCKNLKLFTHISTAYVNGKREGTIFEKPLITGRNRRKGDDDELFQPSFAPQDIIDEMNMALKSCKGSTDYDVTKELKRLGHERANSNGWHNAYQMTKAMGEMVLNEITGDVPLLIIRPSVIESSYEEPFPGWIQGNRMFDPVIISYGKGQLPAYLADPEECMDIMPVDLVVNATIAAIAKNGSMNKPSLNVYHVASSVVNPLKYSDFFGILHEYFNSNPLVDSKHVAKIKFFNNFNDFSEYTREEFLRTNGTGHGVGVDAKMMKKNKAKLAYAEQLCKMYEFVGFFRARFHTGNTRMLMEEMSEDEKLKFNIDAMNIDWRKYFMEIHIPGLRKYVTDI